MRAGRRRDRPCRAWLQIGSENSEELFETSDQYTIQGDRIILDLSWEELEKIPEVMKLLASVSPHVIGLHGRAEGPMDPGPFTALGVFEGIRAAVRHRDGSDDLGGRRVLVEGVGHVGLPLARMLRDAGAELLVCDVDAERAAEVGEELGAEIVAPERADRTKCHVYAPCAVGATLNVESIRQGLAWLTGTELFPPELYYLSQLPSELDAAQTAAVVLMALALSFLATLYPSLRAARLDPVEALRWE